MNNFLPQKPMRVHAIYPLGVRIGVHIASVLYLSYTFYLATLGLLDGDPVQYLLEFTGIGALNLLLLSLSISPLSRFLKMIQLVPLRKTLGVYAAVYALSHFFVFIAFELQFEWGLIISEIVKRPYITIGFLALMILTIMLCTSFNRLQRKLGKTWKTIHRYVYVAVLLGSIHFLWSLKTLEPKPVIYLCLALVLLMMRKSEVKKLFK